MQNMKTVSAVSNTSKPLISNIPRAFPDKAKKSQSISGNDELVLKHGDVSVLPIFDGLINKTPFKKFQTSSEGEASRISSPQSSTRSGIVSTQNMKTEPSTPVLSRDSSVDKSFQTSKSLNFEKKSVQGILKAKEKSRFSYYKKGSLTRRSTSTQRVKIIENY